MSRDSRFEQQPLKCMANYYDHDGSISHPHEMNTSFTKPSERRIPDLMANYTEIPSDRARTGYKETQQYQYRRMRQRPAKVDHQTLDAPRIVLDQTSLDSPTNDSTVMIPTEQTDVSIGDASQEVKTSTSRSSLRAQSDDETHGYRTIKKKLDGMKHAFQGHIRSTRFSGWRMGVLLGSCTSAFVLICNIAMIVVGANTTSGYDRDGIATLLAGDGDTISTWNTGCHIFINVPSTILLSASNYTMQVLNSPTRQELDAAHSSGQWLDIGLVSVHNLRIISRKRAALCLVLAFTSLPLHLFYNAAVFKVITMSKYNVLLLEEGDPSLNKSDPAVVRLDNSIWTDLYDKPSITRHSDLYLTIDQISYGTRQNLMGMNFTITDYLPYNLTSEAFTKLPKSSNGWSTFDEWLLEDLSNITLNLTRKPPTTFIMPQKIHISEGWARRSGHRSRVEISLPFMIVVITFNILKLTVVIGVLMGDSSEYLVTLGDAAASYLQRPENLSRGKSTLDLDKMSSSFGDHQLMFSSSTGWQPRQRRYCSSIGYDKIWSAIVACALLVFVVFFFPTRVIDLSSGMWQWGSASSGTLAFSAKGAATKTTILNPWLSNMPQVLLSLCYINLNALCTTMASTAEWNSLAVSRKGFRVTNPRGNQRSTYFLQLPYKWATPLMITSGGLHWLLSQTFFFSRVDYYGSDDEPDRWTSTRGISFSGLIFSVVCLVVVIAIRWIGRRPMMSNLPLAENCSLMISAACHPSPSEVDPHLEKVKWGVIPGIGRCLLSSKHVEVPEVGKVYA